MGALLWVLACGTETQTHRRPTACKRSGCRLGEVLGDDAVSYDVCIVNRLIQGLRGIHRRCWHRRAEHGAGAIVGVHRRHRRQAYA